jgi:alpha-ketoglutarate-dependent taurine dioxygenase
MAVKTLEVKPIPVPANSAVDFGVQIENVNLENLTDDDFEVIRNAIYNSHVVVLKNQNGLSPKAQYELTRRFDPASGMPSLRYGEFSGQD